MRSKYSSPTFVVNIQREYFAAILSVPRRKWVEYREHSTYWTNRLAKVGKPPFNLRLLNGMLPPVPEATVRVEHVIFNSAGNEIELHLGEILDTRHWDRLQEEPVQDAPFEDPWTWISEHVYPQCVLLGEEAYKSKIDNDGNEVIELVDSPIGMMEGFLSARKNERLFLVVFLVPGTVNQVGQVAAIEDIRAEEGTPARLEISGRHDLPYHATLSWPKESFSDRPPWGATTVECVSTPAIAYLYSERVLSENEESRTYVNAYMDALCSEKVTGTLRRMLVAHCRMPQLCSDFDCLATAAGHTNGSLAKAEYMALGALVCELMGQDAPGTGIEAVGTLETRETGRDSLMLYGEVKDAVDELGWLG
jgi:hypothetical protein